MFTFIDHDDDLSSKRIRDANARKAIRSHVMRDVRRRERLAGLKRTSKRETRPKQTESSSAIIPMHSESAASAYLLGAESASPSSAASSLPDTEVAFGRLNSQQGRWRPTVWRAGHLVPPTPAPSPLAFPPSWLLDPFDTLPGAGETPSMVARLVFYWKSVFVPMTFPEEYKVAEQAETELMVKSSFSDPGSFYGLMTMCAAHRAVLSGRHIDFHALDNPRPSGFDADYYTMKGRCIREMNTKMRDSTRTLSDAAFDTIVNLITSALIIGLFDEARIHLAGLKRMVELRGGLMAESIHRSTMLVAIITADVKSAAGLMVKPIFPLPWDSRPVSSSIQERIRPPASSVLTRLGSALLANPLLSLPLLRVLHVMRDIVLYSQTYRESPASFHPGDHDFFRVLNCEIEHRLLSYIYTDFRSGGVPSATELDVHPVEAVTRVASICFLNQFLIVSPPSSGMARALTKHLKVAVSSCFLSLQSNTPKDVYGLLAWALCIGAQASMGQAERPWFVARLAQLAVTCDWQTWDQFANVLVDYFYLPGVHEISWQSAWGETAIGRPGRSGRGR
ncbi:uncharacterized protein ACLA_053750 [Aspergillus clavatus NRRL 1]|uniref:Tachykinin family protein n=1 Tax=Aspergillus clavatus (strain ATCC 1007 / CBS 513.65 / DSM 816 / NCTC 3887 / NRRL 1 / QM 1276 / 107) TaxID=344612 RepID=A1C905_ASPCL|nr:tachykinin family protein [Aspergillus clavatus NRRL 1]EAW13329.1 tachykinin family protein [Aspergillus clavatus NRRL 1]